MVLFSLSLCLLILAIMVVVCVYDWHCRIERQRRLDSWFRHKASLEYYVKLKEYPTRSRESKRVDSSLYSNPVPYDELDFFIRR